MTQTTLPRLQFAPRLAWPRRSVVIGLPAVLGALALANVLAFEIIPTRVTELWGPYGLAGAGWLAAAVVAIAACFWLPALKTGDDVETGAVIQVAALVGVFLVATQLIIGCFSGFGNSPFAHSPRWMAVNILFGGAPLLAIEATRVAILRCLGPKSLTLGLVASSLALAAASVPFARFTVDGFPAQAEFWGATFIPLMATGLVAGFFATYGGLRASLFVTAPMVAFSFLSPVLPVGDWPVLALVGVAGPALALWVSESLFLGNAGEAAAERRTRFSLRSPSLAWVVTAVMALGILWFSFGFFGFQPAFIPSRSMTPLLNRGDVVVIGPVSSSSIEVGDIILYELGPHSKILHRVIEIRTNGNGQREFITKGDANNTDDLVPVQERQIRGRLLLSVPKVGWLPLKVSEFLGARR